MAILVTADPTAEQTLTFGIGPGTSVVDSFPELERILESSADLPLVVVGPDMDFDDALELAEDQRSTRPELGIVLVRHRLDTGLLTQAMRAGIREVVKFDDLASVAQACRRSEEVTQRLLGRDATSAAGQRRLGRVLTVFSGKGGSGKTTVATNVAVSIASSGMSVCLVDLDLMFGDVAIALQLYPQRSVADAADLDKLDAMGLESIVTRHSSGVEAVLAPVEPGTAENVSSEVVGDLVQLARTLYDVVVVDTPPSFTDHVLAAFDHTDAFLLLCALDVPSIKNLKLTMEMMELLRYPKERWHLVVNRADSRVGLTVADVEKAVGLKADVQIPSDRAVPASLNRGVPIVTEHPRHPVSLAIRKLAEVALQQSLAQPSETEGDAGHDDGTDAPVRGRRAAGGRFFHLSRKGATS